MNTIRQGDITGFDDAEVIDDEPKEEENDANWNVSKEEKMTEPITINTLLQIME